MDKNESTKPKQNRAERKKQKQQTNSVNENDNDSVFEHSQQQQNLPGSKKPSETSVNPPQLETVTMSSLPKSSMSTTSSVTSTPSTTNKKQQQQKQPKSETSSINDVSEINERLANTTIQQNPTGPPYNIPPKKELTKAERRAIQEAQRAAKQQKKGGVATPTNKPNEGQSASANTKKPLIDHTPTPSISAVQSANQRPQSEAGESAMSIISKSTRGGTITSNAPNPSIVKPPQQKRQSKKTNDDRVTLFAHLNIYPRDFNKLPMTSESKSVHPAIVKLGLQYATRQIVGSNLRCVAFLIAIQKMLEDYEGPAGSTNSSILDPNDLNTRLKDNINFLTKCRPNAITMGTAIRYLKTHIERIPRDITIEQAKELLDDVIRSFLREKIDFSSKAIAETYAITKITNGDVILIFGYSSLITRILETAVQRGIDFRVIIVDSRPQLHGLKSARRLLGLNVKCTYVLINAVPFIISEVTKVLLGAHGLLGNGYVMSQVGTAQISLIAKTHNVPVLVCCETYKFCERVQTDSFVFNELGDPNDLTSGHPDLQSAISSSTSETSHSNLNILNMTYDVTPPTFISAVITELGILPCTSVAVVIRMQNKQLDDICAQEEHSIAASSTTTSTMNVLNPSLETVQ